MFKLTIAFATLADLSAFVTKMGGHVQGGTIEHSQTIEGDTAAATPTAKTPAQKAAETKAAKKAAAEAAAKTAAPDSIGANVGATPFAAPTNFAPGMEQPAQPVHHAPAHTIDAGPVHAPMAPAQAAAPSAPAAPVVPAAQPMAPAQPAPVSPQRQQWNDACIALVNQLSGLGLPDTQLAKTMQDTFTEAGCPVGSTIRTLTDHQITQFYPILNRNVNALAAAKASGQFV